MSGEKLQPHEIAVRIPQSKSKGPFPFLREKTIPQAASKQRRISVASHSEEGIVVKKGAVAVLFDAKTNLSSNKTKVEKVEVPFGEQFGLKDTPLTPKATANVQTACPIPTTCPITDRNGNVKMINDDHRTIYDDSRRVDPPGV